MKSYYIEEFENKEKYRQFIDYMLTHSDTFSLVYFKYRESEKTTKQTKEIQNILKPYKIFAVNGNQWPSTVTLNEFDHIYKITLYSANINTKSALLKANGIFDWDYPDFPMDLCFYKDGYAWFASSAHEHYANLILNDNKTKNELNDLGINLHYQREIDESKLFSEQSLKVIVKSFDEANHI